MPTESTSSGSYVDLTKTAEGNLEIALNANGRKEFETIVEMRTAFGTDAALEALLEDHLGNGWEIVRPEEIGALTCAPILSDEVERNDEGEVVDVGRMYWYPEYQVYDEIEELRERLVVLFRGVPPVSHGG